MCLQVYLYFNRGKLYDLSCDSWSDDLDEDVRQKMARMATSAAWGLGNKSTPFRCVSIIILT